MGELLLLCCGPPLAEEVDDGSLARLEPNLAVGVGEGRAAVGEGDVERVEELVDGRGEGGGVDVHARRGKGEPRS
jgi:hypothetical protein